MLEKLKNKGYYYGALLYVFLIPFHQKLTTIAIILWAVFSIFSFKKTHVNKCWKLIFLPIFYFVYFIGLFISEYPSFGFLEKKLSFLVFPLLFFLHNYSPIQRIKIFKFFIFGLFSSGLICLFFASNQSTSLQEGTLYFRANVLEGKGFMESILYGGNYFFGKHFSILHQTVYYAIYLCSGISVLLFIPGIFKKNVRLLLLIFFTLLIFLISNKASFIVVVMLYVVYLITAKLSLVKKGIILFVILGMTTVFGLVNPRIKLAIAKVLDGELILDENARYGFKTRILTWDAALFLIKERPVFGYGVGDVQLKLNKVYSERGYVHVLKNSYNAHNLWMQIWLENGLIGILLLGVIFVLLIRQSIKMEQYQNLFLAFVLLFLVNAFFESIFNRFSGVSFFCFLVCFILSESKENKVKK